MIPYHFYYQLVVLGLLWLSGTPPQTKPSKPITPRRKRAIEPTPFVGLTQRPPCAACEGDAALWSAIIASQRY